MSIPRSKTQDLVGLKFGRLEVILYAGKRSMPGETRRRRMWLCWCDCGKFAITSTSRLNRGDNKSCGCLLMDHSVYNLKNFNAARRAHRATDPAKLKKLTPYAGFDKNSARTVSGRAWAYADKRVRTV